MIKIYTDSSLLIPENRGEVHPLIFDLHYFEKTHQDVTAHYSLVTNPEIADVFLFPINYNSIQSKGYQLHYNDLYNLAQKSAKKLMVYTGGDYGKTFNDDAIIVWRNAGFKKSNDIHTIIIPAFIDDPLQREAMEHKAIAYTERPQISFTGFATGSLKEVLRATAATLKANVYRLCNRDQSDKQALFSAARERFKYLKLLEQSEAIETDFIYRSKYRAGVKTEEQRALTTEEFHTNLSKSPYTFCLRGAGNFSVRFYESLASGRIPVLVDTDCQLPLEHVINWHEHACIVHRDENLIKALNTFHKKYNQDSFIKLQESNRNLYQDYLVRDRFFYSLYNHLKSIL
ncbi:exostosin family protein [uncultured Dokdonia sp.]|uniref:exostosin domain-containing protein n=1 Tax=Dokdonia sp. R78006 TaxID=3093866 RepID=UPI0026092F07|nr:exostosin family protein [uncultured Dokdonia sp.]